jgi:predicted nuclease with RNAse H fold
MRFIGLDLTDPYAREPRRIDVAVVDEQGNCHFSTLPGAMTGTSGSGFLEPISAGPNSGDVLIIDGPLGLAEAGAGLRQCERILRTAGKTPDVLPTPGTKPYAGFVRGSVELAARLDADGWIPVVDEVSLPSATMLEAYPGCSWTALAGARLPHKSTRDGLRSRELLLSRNGVRFQRQPQTHDQLDAALCGWLGWTIHREPTRIVLVGRPAFRVGNHLREGAIVQVSASPI